MRPFAFWGAVALLAVPAMTASSVASDPASDPASAPSNPANAAPNPSSASNQAPPPSSQPSAVPASTTSNPPALPPLSSSTSNAAVSITNTGDVVSTDPTGIPTITGGSSTPTPANDPTGMPTITYVSYGPPTVPPTQNAPYMKQSNLPEGTVFIVVGAILGVGAAGLLLWRAIFSLLLHRSVKRAAMAQHDLGGKAGFPAPPAPFYKYTDQGSNMSLGAGSGNGRGVRRTTRGPIPSSTPSQSNLFFSPTAANANAGGNRSSAFLPSGFYAAGSGSPAPNHGHSISLTNLRPESRGNQGNVNPSPPGTPHFSARRDMSSSSINLSVAPGQRAPSAYLDDLLADDPNSFPPPHMPQSGSQRNSTYSSSSQRNRN